MALPKRRGLWTWLLLVGLVILAACNQAPPQERPNVIAFTANPAAIELGDSATLNWNARGATSIIITDSADTELHTSAQSTGTFSVTPTTAGDHTYTLTATNSAGTATETTTVTVELPDPDAGLPIITSFTAAPPTIAPGGSSTLTWDVTNAESVVITDADDNEIETSTEPTGSTTVSPAAEGGHVYTLVATNATGTRTATVTVTVATTAPGAPTIESFNINPPTISQGETSTLTWEVTGADGIVITDQDDNEITSSTDAAGSVNVTPTTSGDFTYTLTASNAVGSIPSTVTLTVNALPATISGLTAIIVPGSQVQLDWTASNAASIEVFAVPDDASDPDVSLASLGGTETSATVNIPASDYLNIRVDAINADNVAVSATVALTNVVYSGNDYDLYDAQGFIPDAPVPGTLRWVINEAPNGSVIGFAADIVTVGTYGVDLLSAVSYPELTGYPSIIDTHFSFMKDITVSGPATGVTIQVVDHPNVEPGGDAVTWRSRVVFVGPGHEVVLENLTITGGDTIFVGGGIRNDGTLTLNNVEVTANRAWHNGGGIHNYGADATLAINNSVISDNEAAVDAVDVDEPLVLRDITQAEGDMGDGGFGGGIFNEAGSVTITDSVISGNTAKYSGGGIYSTVGAVLTVTGSQFTNNVANFQLPEYVDADSGSRFSYGGGIANLGTATISDSSFTGNYAHYNGGGLYVTASSSTTVTSGTFNTNEAEYGGAIFQQHNFGDTSNLTLTNTEDTGTNSASVAGDFLYQEALGAPPAGAGARMNGLWTPPSEADRGTIYR